MPQRALQITVFWFALLLLAPLAGAADGDHPLVRAYEGSSLTSREHEAFAEYRRVIGQSDGENLTETLEGRLTRLRYRNPSGRSTLEILRNYEAALVGQGMAVDYTCTGADACANRGVGHKQYPGWASINGMNLGIAGDVRYLTGTLAHGDARAYVAVGVAPSVTYLHILEVAALETGRVVANAAALGDALDREGRVVVDGIFFETGSATVQATSDAALTQMAELLRQREDLRLFVVGHTDTTGAFATNLGLSQRRAQSVVAALVERFGIAATRLDAHGVGPLSPRASNGNEAGRAQNRRVEIVVR